ncbi:MAG: dephospho-CoA kinase [Balneola sp.]|jgi:dephospho-CoA kinase|nr:dephospho-CoA kinase [Balneola sp.]MBE79436.1 dephospho-CoA kinase [Balneola sp.]|tara:strand:- start:847 stop:1443 length:597 start_codon:yes stop_codon:yes gene_type:complete
MIKVGITGGIGSGKTTFCKEWEKLGAYVLYADDFAKQLMQEDPKLQQKITKVFGDESYDSEGNLNRPYLAKEAFEKGRVEELNELVHPVLWERAEELANKKEQEGVEVFAKEAAILLQNGRPKDLDFVIIVMADQEQRIERTVERDQSGREQVVGRVEKQPDFQSLTHLADFIVLNNGTLEELKSKAHEIFDKLVQAK